MFRESAAQPVVVHALVWPDHALGERCRQCSLPAAGGRRSDRSNEDNFQSRLCSTTEHQETPRRTLPVRLDSRQHPPLCVGRRQQLREDQGRKRDLRRRRSIQLGWPKKTWLGRLHRAQRAATARCSVKKIAERRSRVEPWGAVVRRAQSQLNHTGVAPQRQQAFSLLAEMVVFRPVPLMHRQ